MKGEFLLKVLEAIEETTYSVGDFIEDFLASSKSNYLPLKYPRMRDHKTLAESIRKGIQEKERLKIIKIQEQKEKQRLYQVIHTMKKQGLIQKLANDSGAILEITEKGIIKKRKLEKSFDQRILVRTYQSEKGSELVIVSFDIPENVRFKRDWLRSVLKNLGLRMLQKSVWIGKIKIPEELISDLRKYNILQFIEIFSVGKTGTIKHVI